MHKKFTIILVSLLLLIAGCSSNTSDGGSSSTSEIVEAVTPQEKGTETSNTEQAELAAASSAPTAAAENEEVKPLDQWIPAGWAVADIEFALQYGDFNEDGLEDVAAALEELESSTEGAPLRALFVALATDDENYTHGLFVPEMIYSSDGGGVYGDPFAGLSIDNGILNIEHYGGSNWRWSNTFKISWHDTDWYLVGYETSSENIMNGIIDTVIYNIESGGFTIDKVDEEGKASQELMVVEGQKLKLAELNLEQFQEKVRNVLPD